MADRDHTLAMRQAIVAKLLDGSNPVKTLTDGRVYGQKAEADSTFPFVRYGVPATSAYEASEWDGSEHSLVLHAFAQGPGEDKCAELAAAVVAELDDAELPLEGLGLLGIEWTGTQVLPDLGATDAWHAVISFRATTVNAVAA